MPDFGELGVPHARDADTFGWFGNQMRVGPGFSELRLIDFLDKAGEIDEEDEVAAMKALQSFLRSIVHPEDWPIFWAAALDNGQGIEDLMGVVRKLTEGLTNRPTRRRAGSSPGRRGTGANSKADSSSRVIRQLEREGRADLALVVQRARDQRATA